MSIPTNPPIGPPSSVSPIALVVEFSFADRGRTLELAHELRQAIAETFTTRTGFISSTLMVSDDGSRLINVARWASEQHWRDATSGRHRLAEPCDDPDFLEYLRDEELVAQVLTGGGAVFERGTVFRELETVAAQ